MALTFYAGSGSPYAWKVWLALEHKGIPYELKMLSFDKGDTKSPEFLAVNPRAKVPAIVEDGVAVSESSVIVEYLEDRYPWKPLLPKDASGRATARRIAAEADSYLSETVEELFNLTLYAKKPATVTEISAAQEHALSEIAEAREGADRGLSRRRDQHRRCHRLSACAAAAARRRSRTWQGHRS